jgi:hypothetical protein
MAGVLSMNSFPQPMTDEQMRAFAGMARLAYFTPLHDHPVLADRKATFILGASGLLITVLLFFLQSIATLVTQRQSWIAIPFLTGLIVFAVVLLSAARWAYLGYVSSMPAMPMSLAFYRNVAQQPLEEYLRQMSALDHKTALRAVLDYNYSVACQALAKFRLVNRALRWMRVAIPLWMLLLLVIALRG